MVQGYTSNVVTGIGDHFCGNGKCSGCTVTGVTAMTGTGAGEVDMAWTDDADATGFTVHYVCVSPYDTGEIDVGKVASYTLQVGTGALCLVAVQAYNANGDGGFLQSEYCHGICRCGPCRRSRRGIGIYRTDRACGARRRSDGTGERVGQGIGFAMG